MTTKEKISLYLKQKKISKREFYSRTGLSNGFLDSGKHLGTENLAIIINTFPDLNINWIVLNQGNMLKDTSTADTTISLTENSKDIQIKIMKQHIKTLELLITEKDKLIAEKERIIGIILK